jgi:signal transduction histidine kinase
LLDHQAGTGPGPGLPDYLHHFEMKTINFAFGGFMNGRGSSTKKDAYGGVRRLLLVSMIFVPAVPLLLAVGIGSYSYCNTTQRLATSAIRQAAVGHRDLLSAFLDERRRDLGAQLDQLFPGDEESAPRPQAALERMLASSREVCVDLGLIDPSGVQVAYSGPFALASRQYGDAPWYRETLARGFFVSDVFLGYRGEPHFVVAAARVVEGQPWVLRATVDSEAFRRLVELVGIGDTLERDAFAYPPQDPGVATFEGEDHGRAYLYASALMNEGRWRLVVRQTRADAFRSATTAGYVVLLILLCGGGVIVILALLASQRVYATLVRQASDVCSLESQLMRAARLAELGEMSAGFAHEINNPLQIMKSDLALLEIDLDDLARGELTPEEAEKTRAEVRESVAQLTLQIDRCAGITKEILDFGRYGATEKTIIDLGEYLPRVGALVENKAKVHGVLMRCEVDPATPRVEADARQLQQVMVNLLNNAIHAVVDRHGSEGGEIDVRAILDDQDRARITVRDNGTGISRENLERIFLPFFSTKPPGKGTGLGLSVCHSIIDSLGGELDVESVKGEGTVFIIRLPRAGG